MIDLKLFVFPKKSWMLWALKEGVRLSKWGPELEMGREAAKVHHTAASNPPFSHHWDIFKIFSNTFSRT